MLKEIELNMYNSVGKNIRIIDINGSEIIGVCVDFTPAYDNEPEEAAITLKRVIKDEKKLAGLIEILSHEIKDMEVI